MGKPTRPQAPPVYRPQPTPKVLQTKTAGGQQPHAGQTPRPPVAPPVYRPERRAIVQPKLVPQPRQPAAAPPPPYRPEQKKIVQPKMPTAVPARTAQKVGVLQPKAANAAPASPRPRQVNFPAPRPVGGRRGGVVQPYIPVKYSEWKTAHPGQGLTDYLALVENERIHAENVAEDDGPKQYATNLASEARTFDDLLARHHNKPRKQVLRALDQLVFRINLVLDEAHSKGYMTDFSKPALLDRAGRRRLPTNDWEQGREEGVIRTFGELVEQSTRTLTVRGPNNPQVPVVAYSKAKLYLPWATCSLILKIYDGWKRGAPLDTRTADERGDRLAHIARPPSLAVARAGSMRSWHMDGHNLLPENPALDETPANVQNYTDYVSRHSSTPNNVGHAVAPSGYIEYTGAGHGEDRTFRVMLDYRRGKIFICYHYQLWSIGGDGEPHTHGQNPGGHLDKNNPWINIDMNA